MNDVIDLTNFSIGELESLRISVDRELARRHEDGGHTETMYDVPLLARKRDLNAKGRGTEEFRKVALPDGNGGYHRAQWVNDMGAVVRDDWCARGIRASERRCSTNVEIGELPVGPQGALVISIDKPVGNGNERANVHAGFLPTEAPDEGECLSPVWDEGIESCGTVKEEGEFWTRIRFSDGRTIKV